MAFFLSFFPFLGCFLLMFLKNNHIQKIFALMITTILFIISAFLWLIYQSSFIKYQIINLFSWINFININSNTGLDGISIIFILLTCLLFFLCLISNWKNLKFYIKENLCCFLIMESLLIAVFLVSDLTFFYVLFESVLIPMFFIIGMSGSRARKIRAGYMFFIYTIVGSVLMFLAVVFLQIRVGSCSFFIIKDFAFSTLEEKILWLSFFIAFAGKIPVMPLHVWLPEAHVEAPTAGSVILAGILLKLGSYGLIRVSIGIFGTTGIYFTPFVEILTIIGILYASFTAVRQTDLKRIVAYTSVAHMNLVVLGLFSYTITGLEGAIFQSISHGFVSSSLFFSIGIIYDRYHTRLIAYYSGINLFMPNFIIYFTIFILANIAFPGTSSFIGEFLLLLSIYKTNSFLGFVSSFSMVLSAIYSLWLLNRFAFGNFNQVLKPMKDLTTRESIILTILSFLILFFGLTTELFLKEIHYSLLKFL